MGKWKQPTWSEVEWCRNIHYKLCSSANSQTHTLFFFLLTRHDCVEEAKVLVLFCCCFAQVCRHFLWCCSSMPSGETSKPIRSELLLLCNYTTLDFWAALAKELSGSVKLWFNVNSWFTGWGIDLRTFFVFFCKKSFWFELVNHVSNQWFGSVLLAKILYPLNLFNDVRLSLNQTK